MRILRRLCVLLVPALLAVGCGGGGGGAPTPPDLVAVAPAGGALVGGTLVTLSGPGVGTGAASSIVVAFGATPATGVAVVDDATITCVSPAGVLGPVDVALTTDHGGDVLPLAFTYYPPPTLASVAPPRGPAAAGTALALTGTGFLANSPGAPVVTIGGIAATSVVVTSDTGLTCTAPAQPGLGDYAVTVSNTYGTATLAQGFRCVAVPTLVGVALTDGPAGGGTIVTLTGTGFDGGVLDVTFDGTPATDVATVDAATLSCATPAGAAGPADVAVRTYGGVASLVGGYAYTVFSPNDPLYANQWHLKNTGQYANATTGEDAHVVPAWDLGYTGRGVNIGVVDDGLELAHEDLAGNVRASASWDYGQDDADPTGNQHGTAVAGVSSAVAGNSLGGTGAAPRSKVAGYAVLVSGSTNGDFADALARLAPATHAYNNSWGSPAYSGGATFGYTEAPLSFLNAIEYGLAYGRGGLGSVYLKAAGNSGTPSAGFDGTNGLRGMLVIGAVNSQGTYSSYSQPGACILVSAPSNHAGGFPGITTTDRTGAAGYSSTNYTPDFGGTSSATPLVTGVVSLVLEARPTLRWWEVPLVLADSARRNDPAHADWVQNGAGRWVNHQYGFGVVDAGQAVTVARAWTPRAGLRSWSASKAVDTKVLKGNATGVSSTINVPTSTGITAVHRAEVTIESDHTYGSDLTIELTSPAGTKSRLVTSFRSGTVYASSAAGVPLISWRHLGEAAAGDWTLKVVDGQNVADSMWSSWTLKLEGEGAAAAATLRAAAPAATGRPPAPELRADGAVTWWDGRAWRVAKEDPTLLAQWSRGADAPTWASAPADLVGVERALPGLTLWRVAGTGVRARLLVAAPAAAAPDAWPVFRDGASGTGRLRALTGRVLVRLAPGLPAAEIAALEARHGLERVRELPNGDGWVLERVSPRGASPLDVARALLSEDGVLHAEPDWWMEWQPY